MPAMISLIVYLFFYLKEFGMTNASEKTVNLRVQYKGETYEGIAPTHLSLLDNIENMNIDIRSSCRYGRCGSCRIRFINGKLNNCIFEDGYVLSCATYLQSDAEVIIEY